MSKLKSPLASFFITIIVIALLVPCGPEEKSLGSSVRIVYLHAAWVMTAELTLLMAGVTGLLALVMSRDALHRWSAALGRTGIVFWVSYLPISLWAAQANWNGLFLIEPRFRLAVIFAVTGVLLQLGLWFLDKSWLTSSANFIYIVALFVSFARIQNIMHPGSSPIFGSGSFIIIGFFVGMLLLSLLAAWFLACVFLKTSKGGS